jgi:hypothetical protein
MQIIKDLNGAVEEYIKSLNLNDYSDKANIEQYAREDFKAGVEFAESKFNEMFLEIVTENQGLKLYKDNEAERFKELAVEFGEYLQGYEDSIYNISIIYNEFLKERNETNS